MGKTTSARKILGALSLTEKGELPDELWEVVERYRGELIRQAQAILGSTPDAEDAVQETFCEAFRNEEKLTQAHSLGAWLRSINRVNALDVLRKQRRIQDTAEASQLDDPRRAVTTGGFSLLETRELLQQAILRLPPGHQQVFQLRYEQQCSLEQISTQLRMPPGTVGWLLSDASSRILESLRAAQTRTGGPAGSREVAPS